MVVFGVVRERTKVSQVESPAVPAIDAFPRRLELTTLTGRYSYDSVADVSRLGNRVIHEMVNVLNGGLEYGFCARSFAHKTLYLAGMRVL